MNNKEKLIKKQALTSLKGSWIVLIAMALVISAIIIAVLGIGMIVQLATKTVSTSTGLAKPDKEFVFYLINASTYAVLFFLSPLVNGFFKSIYTVAHNEIPTIWDLFSFFKSPRLYFKAILLNLILTVILSISVFAFDFSYLVTLIKASIHIQNTVALTFITAVLNVCFGALSVFLISFIYLIFANYAMFLFVDNPSTNIFLCFGQGIKMFVKYFGNTIKLYFSFIGWIALCFFVVPAFYVLPYISTSFATSAKWLILIEKGRN